MKCHHCDNQATVHLTQILNGQMHKMDLCETCAQANGVTNPENLSIGNFMESTDTETSGYLLMQWFVNLVAQLTKNSRKVVGLDVKRVIMFFDQF